MAVRHRVHHQNRGEANKQEKAPNGEKYAHIRSVPELLWAVSVNDYLRKQSICQSMPGGSQEFLLWPGFGRLLRQIARSGGFGLGLAIQAER
jgi:hypothetical protein